MKHVLLILITFLAGLFTTDAQTTAFTYQGHLMDGGASANGNYDIQFTLKTAATAGSTVGTPQVAAPVNAVNGIFVVTLDFGSAVFSGSDRWIELGVRPFGSASAYTTLAPRQKITSMPYAVRAASASSANSATTAASATNATNATNLTGTLSSGNVPTGLITGAMMASNTVGSAQIQAGAVGSSQLASGLTLAGTTSGTFSGIGSALTALNATNIASGTLSDLRLSGNVALENAANVFTAANTYSFASGSLAIRNDSGLVPGLNVTGGGNPGILRLRNAMEIWPSDDLSRGTKLDLRATNGSPTITLDGSSGTALANSVGIGDSSPDNALDVESAGTASGGVTGFTEVVAHFKNSTSGQHTAASIDALTGQDAILYFGSAGSPDWGIRSDTGNAALPLQFRYHSGGANTAMMTLDNAGNLSLDGGGDVNLTSLTSVLGFGSIDREQIILHRNHGKTIGTQPNTIFMRSNGGFAWYNGGIFSNIDNDPGATGTRLMSLSSSGGLNINSLTVTGGGDSLTADGNVTVNGLIDAPKSIPFMRYSQHIAPSGQRYITNIAPNIYFYAEDITVQVPASGTLIVHAHASFGGVASPSGASTRVNTDFSLYQVTGAETLIDADGDDEEPDVYNGFRGVRYELMRAIPVTTGSYQFRTKVSHSSGSNNFGIRDSGIYITFWPSGN